MTAKPSKAPVTVPLAEALQRSGQESPTEYPRVCVVGSDELVVHRVARELDQLRVSVVTQGWEQMLETLQSEFAAIVLVTPIRKVASSAAVEIIRDHPSGGKVPIFSVVPDATSSQAVRRLYKAGVSAVFNWPRESKILATLFAETFGIVEVRGRSSQADKALTRTVRAHLRAGPGRATKNLRLFTRDGLVSVSGQVRTLAKRWEIIEVIAAVPGVRAVIAEALRVYAEAIPSRQLSQRVRNLIVYAVDLDPSTLVVSTRNGRVELSGTAADRAELHRLEELISNLKGVRELDSSVSISAESQRRDSRVAHRLRHFLANLYPKDQLSLAVFDGVAVISGRVRRLSIKRSVEGLLRRDIDIRQVVNKLEVRPRGRS